MVINGNIIGQNYLVVVDGRYIAVEAQKYLNNPLKIWRIDWMIMGKLLLVGG